jgi:hypothetical protein
MEYRVLPISLRGTGLLFGFRPSCLGGAAGGFLAFLGGHVPCGDLAAFPPFLSEILPSFLAECHLPDVTTIRGGYAIIILTMRWGCA